MFVGKAKPAGEEKVDTVRCVYDKTGGPALLFCFENNKLTCFRILQKRFLPDSHRRQRLPLL